MKEEKNTILSHQCFMKDCSCVVISGSTSSISFSNTDCPYCCWHFVNSVNMKSRRLIVWTGSDNDNWKKMLKIYMWHLSMQVWACWKLKLMLELLVNNTALPEKIKLPDVSVCHVHIQIHSPFGHLSLHLHPSQEYYTKQKQFKNVQKV